MERPGCILGIFSSLFGLGNREKVTYCSETEPGSRVYAVQTEQSGPECTWYTKTAPEVGSQWNTDCAGVSDVELIPSSSIPGRQKFERDQKRRGAIYPQRYDPED